MEPLECPTRSREYHYKDDDVDMNFKVVVTLRASTVERWIRDVKRRYLDAAPMKIVGLDCEFTDASPEETQRAAVLQLSVATDTLVFHICHTDRVPQALKDFLMDTTIKFCGAAINNDQRVLLPYGIHIPSIVDLQRAVQPNPTYPNLPSLYTIANRTIGTRLENKNKKKKKKDEKKKVDGKKKEKEEDLRFGWGKFQLSFYRIKYAARDAGLGYEIARRCLGAM
ncbi:unnamed protein product [Alopecurus aequalis]